MSRKSLIICLAILLTMVLGIGIAVSILYSGTGSSDELAEKVYEDSRYLLLPAVPSDAVMVCCFTEGVKAISSICTESAFPRAILNSGFKPSQMTVSLHFSGKLQPLYIFDLGKASDTPSQEAELLMSVAAECGMQADYQNCSTIGSKYDISDRSIVVASTSEGLVKSSIRHLQKGVSILDANGFTEASPYASDNAVFIPNATSGKILSSLLTGKYRSWSSFAPKLSDWIVLDIDNMSDDISFSGSAVTDGEISDFLTVFDDTRPSSSELSSILPSYTLSALTMNIDNTAEHISDYQLFLDARQSLQTRLTQINELEEKVGFSPIALFTRHQAEEVATCSFMKDGNLERVNLVRVAKPDTLENYSASVHPYPYRSFTSLVFGDLYKLPDESCFTYYEGWIVSGSKSAVSEFASGNCSKYTLKEFMVNAGMKDLFAAEPSSIKAYMSFTEDKGVMKAIFRTPVFNALDARTIDSDYSGMFLSIGQPKHPYSLTFSLFGKEIKKSKPLPEREVKVDVSKGPFRVRNSGTGKMNIFYQQDNLYLCLKEEGGKGLWGVPFSAPICGTAQTIDYYANGKLQILFGAGTKLYLIDRLGRFVTGFPVDIKKEILKGPDVYDFNGARRYNVMVLHKDNTIDMYNLKGQKPESWNGIRPSEIIRDLPERIIVGGNTFWVVRTSVQTLIYPFGGGQPLTTFTGDQMALPDSDVSIVDGSAVELQCYDGKSRIVKLK